MAEESIETECYIPRSTGERIKAALRRVWISVRRWASAVPQDPHLMIFLEYRGVTVSAVPLYDGRRELIEHWIPDPCQAALVDEQIERARAREALERDRAREALERARAREACDRPRDCGLNMSSFDL